jgi:predicted RNA-binding protein with PUA-like domain
MNMKRKRVSTRTPAPRAKGSRAAGKGASPMRPPQARRVSPWADVLAPRPAGERRLWLMKSEPTVFSFDDLLGAPGQVTGWDGVRNLAARNFMRDGMKRGDRVFFYHSSTNPQAIVGICEVVREGYPDATALDRQHPHFDEDSDPDAPTWFMVDVRAVERLARPVTLAEIKSRRELANMALVRIGRLSVTPVTAREWETICAMAQTPA